MRAVKLPNGNLLIPMRAESDDEPGLVGDGVLEIGPDHPLYAVNLEEAEDREELQQP